MEMEMFDLPDAKRVRRADLRSHSASPHPSEPDAELAALFQARLESLYGSTTAAPDVAQPISPIDDKTAGPPNHSAEGDDDGHEDLGFEFRLFASILADAVEGKVDDVQESRLRRGDASKVRLQRVILDDEDAHELDGPGAFVVPERPQGYYFVDAKRASWQRQGYQEMAVGGEQVRAWLGVRYRAWEVPWRVRVVRSTTVTKREGLMKGDDAVLTGSQDGRQDQTARRKKGKLGKKSRIKLRIRSRMARERDEKERREKELKEEGEREKKSRRNKEKQARKRAKEKARKMEERTTSNVDTQC